MLYVESKRAKVKTNFLHNTGPGTRLEEDNVLIRTNERDKHSFWFSVHRYDRELVKILEFDEILVATVAIMIHCRKIDSELKENKKS